MSLNINNLCFQERRDITKSLLNVLTIPDRSNLSPRDTKRVIRLIRQMWPGESDMEILEKLNPYH